MVGQRDGEETHQEVPHVFTAEGDVATGDLVGLQLEVGDGLLRAVEHGLLAGDEADIASGVGDGVLVGVGADAGVDDDLRQLRHLVLVLVAAGVVSAGNDRVVIVFLERSELFAHDCDRISDPDAEWFNLKDESPRRLRLWPPVSWQVFPPERPQRPRCASSASKIAGLEHEVRHVDGALALGDLALRIFLGLLEVALDHGHAFDHGAVLGGTDLEDLAGLALVGAGDDDDGRRSS